MVLTSGFMKDRRNNNPHFLLSVLLWVLFAGIHTDLFCQTNGHEKFPVLFYNVENLFDCDDDTLKNDNEFLPGSVRHWTFKRYNDKVNKIAKVILASNGWDLPALAGLCEVENKAVLNRLIWETGLNEAGYRFVHHESPDKRGIDVALLYRKDVFSVIHDSPVVISDPDENFFTRDILYVKGVMFGADTLNVFVCHLPSKYGGEMQSERKRIAAAKILRVVCDSIFNANPESNILVMGDMNESPDEQAMSGVLKAGRDTGSELVNLSFILEPEKVNGTIKYRGRWYVYDQIIVSRHLMRNGFSVAPMQVVELPFLLEDDESHTGVKPFRTYIGPMYHGGFSDHLPVKTVIVKDH